MIAPMKALLHRLLFLLGITLTMGGFVATAAEIAASVVDPSLGLLPGLARVWSVLAPASYAAFQDLPSAALWLKTLSLPGWLALGVPGLVLIALFRERGDALSSEHEQSLFLFDELTKRAREDGYDNTDADLQTTGQADFVPAEDHYARDDVVDDLRGDHDFLLDSAPHTHDKSHTT